MKIFYLHVGFRDSEYISTVVVVADTKEQAFSEVRDSVIDPTSLDAIKVQHKFSLDAAPVVLEQHLAPDHEEGRFRFPGLLTMNHNGRLITH